MRSFVFILAFGCVSASAQTTHAVTVQNFSFSPATLSIFAGDTVEWTNVGGFHNVASTGGAETFRSGDPANAPWTFEHTFTDVGSTQYQCDAHAGSMQGTVNVSAGSSSEEGVPGGSRLANVGSNPVSARASFLLTQSAPGVVRAVVVDARGREVAVLWDGNASTSVALVWDASRAAPGRYVLAVTGVDLDGSVPFTVAR